MMSNETPHFSFKCCTFSLKPEKYKSLRGFIWNKLDNPRHTITFETSFMGY